MLRSFIVEHCEMSPDFRVTKAEFYDSYLQWEKKHGRQPVHIGEIGQQMKELNFVEARTKNTRFWMAIRLIDHDVVASKEVEKIVPISNISQSATTLEEALNERLRQEMMGVCTYQKF